jgi:hypothetical protein
MAFLMSMLPALLGSGHPTDQAMARDLHGSGFLTSVLGGLLGGAKPNVRKLRQLHGSGLLDSIMGMIGMGKAHEVDAVHGSGILNSLMGAFGLGKHPQQLERLQRLHGSGFLGNILGGLLGGSRQGAGWMDFAKKGLQLAPHVINALGGQKPRRRRNGAGWMDFGKSLASASKPLLAQYGGETGSKVANAMGAFGLGKQRRRGKGWLDIAKKGLQLAPHVMDAFGGADPRSRALSAYGMGGGAKDGRTARAQLVRKIMQERGVSLPQASRIIKQEGLHGSGFLSGLLGMI